MDTLSHALSGALIGRAAGPLRPGAGVPPARVRGWVGFCAAAFPDIDFPLRFFDMALYLRLHRTETHSLLLLPLWAVLLGLAFYLFHRRRYRFRWLAGIAGLGILVHILGDIITAYGTRILAPVSDYAPALGWVLVIDPWLSLLLAAALLLSILRPHPAIAWAGLAVATLFVLFQGGLNELAARHGHERVQVTGWQDVSVDAYAQPFSPFNRVVLVARAGEVERARINLLRRATPRVDPAAPVVWQLHQQYRPVDDLHWQHYRLLPAAAGDRGLARSAWHSEALAAFRDFATHPVLHRLDREADGRVCVWFKDLRYAYDPLPIPFRHGACRDDEARDWQSFELHWPGGERRPLSVFPAS